MKHKILTAVCIAMLLIPWTILALRTFDWALESPAAEIMIACYAVFMIFTGIFHMTIYIKVRVQNHLMKICLVISILYAVFGIAVLGMMV